MTDERRAGVEERPKPRQTRLSRGYRGRGGDTAGECFRLQTPLTGRSLPIPVSLYVIVDQDTDRSGGEICEDIEAACEDLDCDVQMLSSSSMSSYTSALGGKRSIRRDIPRRTTYKLQTAAEEIGEKLAGVEGITAVDDGLEETDSEFHFTVDKRKAMRNGLTVAQVYMQVAKVLTSDTTSTPAFLGGR